MPLYKQSRSPFWWYSITVHGKRVRASTGLPYDQRNRPAAQAIEAAALLALSRGDEVLPTVSRGCTLQAFSVRFLEWVSRSAMLSESTRKFYKFGWRLLSMTALSQRRVDAITRDDVDCTTFRRPVIDRRTLKPTGEIVDCSPAYCNQAIRTLKVMLGKAEEWGILARRPKLHARRASHRQRIIDSPTEAAIDRELNRDCGNKWVQLRRLRAWFVFLCVHDAGMRPREVFPMRIEHLYFHDRRLFIPKSKTRKGERWVGMSERMAFIAQILIGDRREGWVLPNAKSKTGHLMSIDGTFSSIRKRLGLPKDLVLYSGRHTFATETLKATGNIFAVSQAMGHASIKSMEPYQHHELGELTDVINARNRGRDARLAQPQPHRVGHTVRSYSPGEIAPDRMETMETQVEARFS